MPVHSSGQKVLPTKRRHDVTSSFIVVMRKSSQVPVVEAHAITEEDFFFNKVDDARSEGQFNKEANSGRNKSFVVPQSEKGSFSTHSSNSNNNSDSYHSMRNSTQTKDTFQHRTSTTGFDNVSPDVSSKSNDISREIKRNPSYRSSEKVSIWPGALKQACVNSFSKGPNLTKAKEFLGSHDWPIGFQEALLKSISKIPMRFFIVDDSGSMSISDGRRVLKSGEKSKVIQCTRWAELVQSLTFCAELSDAAEIPSEFRLLNGADPVIVGLSSDSKEDLNFATEVFQQSPAGQTPLCEHITAVVKQITEIADDLRSRNQKVAVIIATDGEASDGDVTEALRPLQRLPVWLVLRLCTNEQKVVDYWNSIDQELELEVDCLDDLVSDAKEVVQKGNGWLCYGEALHRLREFGACVKEFDLIDEKTLNSEQARLIISYVLFNGDVSKVPHPEMDWQGFISTVKKANLTKSVFDTITGKTTNWIDINKLEKAIRPNSDENSRVCQIS